jgi:hypothetical protein
VSAVDTLLARVIHKTGPVAALVYRGLDCYYITLRDTVAHQDMADEPREFTSYFSAMDAAREIVEHSWRNGK